ncbi:hypothetical protein CES87_25435 [Pseudomonas sp. ERMR1:02]|nr:hypothetical protein CES87_25435 [Pseudomonas sp. ERMR1:02]
MVVNDDAGGLIHLVALGFFASRLAPTVLIFGERKACGQHRPLVGASLLAMVVNDDAGALIHLVALGFFASRLAPTV